MTKYYSEVLKIKDWELKRLIRQLESKTNNKGHDLHLFSEIKQDIYSKIKELNLDPFDSNSLEIYHALNIKLEELDRSLIKYLRTKAAHYISSDGQLRDGLLLFLNDLTSGLKVLAIKKVFYKKYFKINPPKRTLRELGFRSIDSLIKKEPIELIVFSANIFESTSYLQKFYNHHKNLKITDFEERSIAFMEINPRYQTIFKSILDYLNRDFIVSYETAAIIVANLDNTPKKGLTTKLLIEILDAILLLQSMTAYLKVSEFRNDFAARAIEIYEHEPYVNSALHQTKLPFKMIHKLSAKYRASLGLELPFIDDFRLMDYKELLPSIIKEFNFFKNSDHLYYYDQNKSVSFNILDVATNLMNSSDFNNRSTKHLSRSLYQELMGRYLNKEHLEAIIEQESA